jgi:hypothetical protein
MGLCEVIQPWTIAVGVVCIVVAAVVIDVYLMNRPKGVALIGITDFKLFKRRYDKRTFKAMSEVEKRDGIWLRKCLEIETHKIHWLDAAQLVLLK